MLILNDRELHTVLAALRYFQGRQVPLMIEEIANNAGEIEPLSEEEIDSLCVKLNTDGHFLDELEKRVRLARQHGKEFTFIKKNKLWYWYDRDQVEHFENYSRPFTSFWETLEDAVSTFIVENESDN